MAKRKKMQSSKKNKSQPLFSVTLSHVQDPEKFRGQIEATFLNVQVEENANGLTASFPVPQKKFSSHGAEIIQVLSSLSDKSLQSWIKAPIVDSQIKMSTVRFDTLRGFHFPSYTTVQFDSKPIWNQNFTMNLKPGSIRLRVISSTKKETDSFLFRPIDVDGPILINDTATSYEIYFCMANPASCYYNDDCTNYSFNGRSFNFCLSRSGPISPDQSWQIISLLKNYSPDVFNVSHLNKLEKEPSETKEQIYDTFLKGYLVRAWRDKYAAVLPAQLPESVLAQFANSTEKSLEVLLELAVPKRFEPLEMPTFHHKYEIDRPSRECNVAPNYFLVGRVNVTPSRFVVKPMRAQMKSRVFRYFPDPENFLIITFIDEHGSNPWRSQFICDYYQRILQTGIEINGKRFTFLGCSNSQLREGRCCFSCLDRQEVYKKIGNFPAGMNAGRKLTRLGLAFGSSIETLPVDPQYLRNVAPDKVHDGVNFSDGIGTASRDFFNRVKLSMNLDDPTVCALQIRIGGIKGVISVNDDQQQDIIFRKSMKKFESSHNMLEVLNKNYPISLHLNRHIILLLSSFGIDEKVFIEMQHNDLMSCMDALTEEDKALSFVKLRSNIFDWSKLPKKQIVQEPFFRQLLISNTIDFISSIVEHAKISVAKGRLLMGVLDETGTLNYGEVYAHIIEEGVDIELEGRVVVYRSPSVLPSDVRVLYARKNVSQRIKNLYTNCLVLPSKGPASHAHECAGGDLDGDQYSIIWDEQLVPNIKIPGEIVIEVETKELKKCERSNSDYEMMRFYCNFVWKNKLGTIANAHLATADKYGMQHPKTVALARYVTAETDAPVKGYTVDQIDANLLPTEYPDFMLKFDKKIYRSQTALGSMFREAYPLLKIFDDPEAQSQPTTQKIAHIPCTQVDKLYKQYQTEINQLLLHFDLQSEPDLFSGTPIWRKRYMSAFKMKTDLRELVNKHMERFWHKWIEIFNEFRASNRNNGELTKLWYDRPKSCPTPAHSFSFLAMPHLELVKIQRKSLSTLVQHSTAVWIAENKLNWLKEWEETRNIGLKLHELLNEYSFFGASALGLNNDNSEVDYFIPSKEWYKHIGNYLGPGKIIIKDKTSMMTCYGSTTVNVTTSVATDVCKSYILGEIFDENPDIWQALRVLTEWARPAIKSNRLISFLDFFNCFVEHLGFGRTEPSYQESLKLNTIIRVNNWMETKEESRVGEYIVGFLKFLSARENKTLISSMLNVDFPVAIIDELAKKAEYAIYVFGIYEGNVRMLFGKEDSKELKRLQSMKLASRPSNDWNQMKQQGPLGLLPLRNATQQNHGNKKIEAKEFHVAVPKSSPFPEWTQDLIQARAAASKLQFKEVQYEYEDRYILIFFVFNKQDYQVKLYSNGTIKDFKHRTNTNTFDPWNDKQLELIKQSFRNRSLLDANFHAIISENTSDSRRLPHPLIRDAFRLGWIIKSMRVVMSQLKFVNPEKDFLILNEVTEGVIHNLHGRFEWKPRRIEFEPQLNPGRNENEKMQILKKLKNKLYDKAW